MRMDKRIATAGLGFVLVASFVGTSEAQRPGGGGGGRGGAPSADRLFAQFDKNKDGKLTASEVPAPVWSRISKADSNGDGAVTVAELKAAGGRSSTNSRTGRVAPTAATGRGGRPDADVLFGRFDTDSDDALSNQEVPFAVWRRLSQADQDGDGKVDRTEFDDVASLISAR